MEASIDRRPSLLIVIAGSALLIGTLDLIDAFVFFDYIGVPAIRVPQSIATGFLGQLAYHDGMVSAAFSLMLHYLIAFAVAGTYMYISGELPLYRKPILSGAIYGVVYCVMKLHRHSQFQFLSLTLTSPFGHLSTASLDTYS